MRSTAAAEGAIRAWSMLFAVVCLVFTDSLTEGSVGTGNDVMTNHWHVHLKDSFGKEAAMEVAKRNGFSYVAPVSVDQQAVGLRTVWID
jgi:hypothetical protein